MTNNRVIYQGEALDVRFEQAYYLSTSTPQVEAWALWCKEIAQGVYIIIDGNDPKVGRVYRSFKTAYRALCNRLQKYIDLGAKLS